jgi:hypothetical protein
MALLQTSDKGHYHIYENISTPLDEMPYIADVIICHDVIYCHIWPVNASASRMQPNG